MPTWAWVAVLFVGMTAAYWVGVALGQARVDAAPNATVWLKAKEMDAQYRKEVALEALHEDAKWEMEALKRGIYDNLPFDESDDQFEEGKTVDEQD